MGKIVKYCSSCDEGFAEKFGFCPDCGAPLQAFEMNPLTQEFKTEETVIETSAPVFNEIDEINPLELADETPVYDDGFVEEETPLYAENADVIEDEASEQIDPVAEETPSYAAPATIPAAVWDQGEPAYDGPAFKNYEPAYAREDDGGYYVTVIQEKNVRQRNLLLLGSTFFVLTMAIGGAIVSLFQKDLGIKAIGDEYSLAYLVEQVPMVVEEEPKPEKDKGGGGGGGGREEKEETSQGDLADQQKNPVRPPDVNVHRSDNFELKMPIPSTQGDQKFEKKFNQWGDPNSRFAGLSNGTGSGGGQGSGNGTGQGSGNGTGAGSGNGSGSGSGDGSGNGSGTGSGGDGAPPPPKPVGVTTPVKILAKPQAKYNDEGRTNGVQGSVRLKITLLANGQVGSITPVTRLPHGLTEQAIAAARQLRFEPKKINGIPQSTIVTIDYSFSIY